jgi:poly(hydroxyalkanoate) granule-associated protein
MVFSLDEFVCVHYGDPDGINPEALRIPRVHRLGRPMHFCGTAPRLQLKGKDIRPARQHPVTRTEDIMTKKLKMLAGSSENQLASTVKESAHQIWLAGLGAFAKAQVEGNKVFDALVKEGEMIQAKTRKVADDKMAEVAMKAAGTWDRLEQVFEDRVARALGSLGVPSKKDIERLSKRVAELTEVVQQLTDGRAPKAAKPAAMPATKAAVKPAAIKPVVARAKAKPAKATMN